MKPSPDQTKKTVLILIALAALVYGYFSFLLSPLQTSQARIINTTAELENKIAASKKMVAHVSQLEQSATRAIGMSEKIDGMIPDGAPLAWVPPRIKSFFATDEMEIGAIRLLNSSPLKQPELSAFGINQWVVEFPRVNFLALAKSMARFENENPLWSILIVRVATEQAAPEEQFVTLTIATLVKK